MHIIYVSKKGNLKQGSGTGGSLTKNIKTSRGLTRAEIGNFLDDLKTDILSSLSPQLDAMNINKKQ